MPELPYMTDEARSWIGREWVDVSDPVSERQIKEYVAGTGDYNPFYADRAFAAGADYGGIVAPPLFYDAPLRRVVPEGQLLQDGQYNDLSVPGLFGRSMAGGLEVELFTPVRAGDVITRRTRIADIFEKQGKSGKMIFQVNESTYTNQRDEVVAKDKRTLIFR